MAAQLRFESETAPAVSPAQSGVSNLADYITGEKIYLEHLKTGVSIPEEIRRWYERERRVESARELTARTHEDLLRALCDVEADGLRSRRAYDLERAANPRNNTWFTR